MRRAVRHTQSLSGARCPQAELRVTPRPIAAAGKRKQQRRTTMTNADRAYDDLIEIGACLVACSDLTGCAVPRRVHELISEAADLRGAWAEFSAGGRPGAADLPIVDAVIDDVNVRADALRNEIVGSACGGYAQREGSGRCRARDAARHGGAKCAGSSDGCRSDTCRRRAGQPGTASPRPIYGDIRLNKRPHFSYMLSISLIKGAFREGTFGMRERVRCPRADECDPLPGGSGAPVGRQKDRSARSVLNRRLGCKGAKHPRARDVGNPVLGLSHRGKSRWRVPR
jgi:hypothetical protein